MWRNGASNGASALAAVAAVHTSGRQGSAPGSGQPGRPAHHGQALLQDSTPMCMHTHVCMRTHTHTHTMRARARTHTLTHTCYTCTRTHIRTSSARPAALQWWPPKLMLCVCLMLQASMCAWNCMAQKDAWAGHGMSSPLHGSNGSEGACFPCVPEGGGGHLRPCSPCLLSSPTPADGKKADTKQEE